MASMGDMPNIARDKMSFCSCHTYQVKTSFLPLKSSILTHFRGQNQLFSPQYQILRVARPPGDTPGRHTPVATPLPKIDICAITLFMILRPTPAHHLHSKLRSACKAFNF